MIKAGLYKVEFHTPRGNGAGVVVLDGGKFRGGDSAFYYSGTFSEDGDKFTATVHIKRHTAGGVALVGEQGTINVHGTSSGEAASLSGTVAGMPGVTFQAHMKRLSD
jgi:hypothetical protein